ncbi:electron transfer flavoprotein subunit alpha/FixB family protein [Caldiplasma sukawensis]
MSGLLNAKVAEKPDEYKNVMIFLETRDGKIAKPALEMITAGSKLARDVNEKLIGVVMSDDVSSLSDEAGYYGCDIVIGLQSKALKEFRTLPYAAMFSDVIMEMKPNIVLVAATRNGRDMASRVAVRCRTGVAADCTEFEIDKKTRIMVGRKPSYGDSAFAEILCKDYRPQMATARPGTFIPPERDEKRKFQKDIRNVKIPDEFLGKEIVEFKPKKEMDLSSAKVIVSGGLGLGKPSGFKLIDELAKELNGQVGATRPVVDLGWISRDHQIGQTGQTVRPDIYIAAGISGSPQHTMGMKKSGIIISINSDPDAEINQISDYIITADLYTAIPKLLEEIRKRKGATVEEEIVKEAGTQKKVRSKKKKENEE